MYGLPIAFVGYLLGYYIARKEYRGTPIPWRALENGNRFDVEAAVEGTSLRIDLLLREKSHGGATVFVEGSNDMAFDAGTSVVKTKEGLMMLK